MGLRVQKYGGASVATPEHIQSVADRIVAARQSGDDLLVVVSAMGRTTDDLVALAGKVSDNPNRRELDMLITTGERVTMSLLAMALHDRGVGAISFTGSQSGILTDGRHTNARIIDVRPDRVRAALQQSHVVIIAGFQGVNPETREITTLGRGGSDTTAVAMAATLEADVCEVYKDVVGVCTADPRVVEHAQCIPQLSYELCSTLARSGANVLHSRCVDLAAARGVRIEVRSVTEPGAGTRIEGVDMEGGKVQAVAQRARCSIAIAEGNAGGRGEARDIIESVHSAYPNIELLAHEQAGSGHGVLVWLGERADTEDLVENFREMRGPGGEWRISAEHDATFVSLVGLGLGETHVARAEAALERARVPMVALRVTPTSLVFRVPGDDGDTAVRTLHATFLEGDA